MAQVLDGVSRVTVCQGEPPLTPRRTGPAQVHLAATAGGPLPGDEAVLELEVGPGATLVVRAVAATVALPGPEPQASPSRWTICARVADGGSLVLLGEPLVAATGCRHETTAEVSLGAGARLVWRDLLVPGRSGEESGDAVVGLRVEREGRPLLAQQLAVGPGVAGWHGPAVLGGARCVGSLLLAGPPSWRPAATVRVGPLAALLPLAEDGAALGTALGSAPEVCQQLDAWLPAG